MAVIIVTVAILFIFFMLSAINRVMKKMILPSDCPVCGTKNSFKVKFKGGVVKINMKVCDNCGYTIEIPF